MDIIKNILQTYKNGTYLTLKTQREAKTKVSCTKDIQKITVYRNARLGIEYDNLSQTKKARREGELTKENQGLKWGNWKKFPYVIEHKGNDYLRMYVNKKNIKTIWLLDGVEVPKQFLIDDLLASEKRSSNSVGDMLTLTIKENSIIS